MSSAGDAPELTQLDEGYQVAWETTLRTVDEQRFTLTEVRQRANGLLTASLGTGGVITSLVLAGNADDVTMLGYAGIALVALACLAVFGCTAFIWYSKRGWVFNLDAKGMVDDIEAGKTTADEIRKSQSKKMNRHINSNRRELDCLMRAFNISLGVMLLEIAGVCMLIGDVANA